MRPIHPLVNLASPWLDVLRVQIHVAVLLLRYLTLSAQRHGGAWRYDTLRSIEIGENLTDGPFTEVIVYLRTAYNRILGRFICWNRIFIGAGRNIRTAGRIISIGSNMIGWQKYLDSCRESHFYYLNQILTLIFRRMR